MDLRDAVRNYVSLGNELFNRLRSSEGPTLSKADLHIFRVQLYILDTEARALEKLKNQSEDTAPPQTE